MNFSSTLIVELSPCHPGFHYDNTTEKCVWFGVVEGKTTKAVCPNNYCNFTCCETTNGNYQLSPVRTDQCS